MKLSSPANWSSSRRPLTLALSLGLLVSCDKPSSPDPTRLSMVQGDHQCGAPEVILKLPLEVRVLGPRSRDWLGRRGSRPPVGGGVVTFALESMREREEQLAENSEEDDPPRSLTTGSSPLCCGLLTKNRTTSPEIPGG